MLRGVELLPIGQEIIRTRQILEKEFTREDYETLRRWATLRPWRECDKRLPVAELRITRGAYPQETREAIEQYLGACETENEKVRAVLRFALLCVLESVSFTRKDGQYLRWVYRSGRTQERIRFDKGRIFRFEQAICEKIKEILADVVAEHRTSLLAPDERRGEVRLYNGSCLDVLPRLDCSYYDAIMTSPLYCNRYDYARTYALELALLGIDESGLAALRQAMVSCTVESRGKDLLKAEPRWEKAVAAADGEALLQAILKYLDAQKVSKALNNNGIPRMVRGYFYEMACVISECARVLKPGAWIFMVNDNRAVCGSERLSGYDIVAPCREIGVRGGEDSRAAFGQRKQQPADGGVWARCASQVRLRVEKAIVANRPYREHLGSSEDLITTYEATRAGFVALALERNRRATPYVCEARALQGRVESKNAR